MRKKTSGLVPFGLPAPLLAELSRPVHRALAEDMAAFHSEECRLRQRVAVPPVGVERQWDALADLAEAYATKPIDTEERAYGNQE